MSAGPLEKVKVFPVLIFFQGAEEGYDMFLLRGMQSGGRYVDGREGAMRWSSVQCFGWAWGYNINNIG